MGQSLRERAAAHAPPKADRLPLGLFSLLVVAAAPLILFHLGAYHWFLRDDFVFLADREGRLPDLVTPYGGAHWVALPRMIYLALWQVFGMRSYVPYQAVVVGLHLSVCVMLLIIMRRSGVTTWIACAAASVLVLFGPGAQNIVWAFQISFTGSLAYGLAHLLAADHDGRFGWRDVAGVCFGAAALMSSGVGITMLAVVGGAVWLRRGPKMACLHVAPLAALFAIWALVAHPSSTTPFGRPTLSVLISWMRSTMIGTFEGIGRFAFVSVALAAMALVGTVLALGPDREESLRDALRRLSMPLALFAGGLAFSATSGMGRWFIGAESARASRYIYMGAAFTLPLVAVGAQAVARRWNFATPVLVGLFLVAIPFNLDGFEQKPFGSEYMEHREYLLTTAVRMPFAYDVASDVQPIPDPYASDAVNMGFLLSAMRHGDLNPSDVKMTRAIQNEFKVRLGVAQRPSTAFPLDCTEIRGPELLSPAKGTRYIIGASLDVSTAEGTNPTGPKVRIDPNRGGKELTIELDDLNLLVSPPPDEESVKLCEL